MLVQTLEVQKGCNGDVDTCIFSIISVIRTIYLSEQPPDQRGSDKRGCTVCFNAYKYVHVY